MKKTILLILLLAVSGLLFAQKAAPGPRADLGIGAAGSIYQGFITATPKVLYDFGLLALGGGVKTYFGLSFKDIYAAPFITAELGWLYLYGGISFVLKGPDESTSETGFVYLSEEEDFTPFFSLGLAPPVIPIGPGKLGFDISADMIWTSSPVEIVDDSGNFLADIIATIFATAITTVMNMAKVGFSVFYTRPL